MDFDLTEDQDQLRKLVREVMAREAGGTYLRMLDEQTRYPYELYKRWAEVGLLTLPFPPEYGGMGGSVTDFALVSEEIGRHGYDLSGVYGVPVFNGLNIQRHGSEQQRERYLGPLMRGEIRLSLAMTEPGAGSDAASMTTSATFDGDEFVINGEKVFASGAGVEDTTIAVYCRTNPGADNKDSLSCLLVDNKTPGLEIRPLDMLGRHMYPTTQLHFDNVRVPAEELLGPLHGGWSVMLSGLQLERLVTSAAYVGNAQTVIDEALEYAQQRRQFGKRVGDFQVIAHRFADMQTKVDAARLLTYRAASLLDSGRDALREICMAKLFGSEVFLEVARQGVQVLGGYGYSMEFPMQRHVRAALGCTITAGTSEMQRETIARTLGLRPS